MQHFLKFHRFLVNRFVWPHSPAQGSLHWWRAYILASILMAALLFGSLAFLSAATLIVKNNVWGLAVIDFSGLVLCLIFMFIHKIRYEVRAWVTLISFYIVGITVILSVGPLSGGPAYLFAFAVLAGILMGNVGALIAITMNTISIIIIGGLIYSGRIGSEFPFFLTPHVMIAAGVNFLVLNAIISVSVAALLKGLNNSEKRYRLIAENVADVIWTMDMNFKFTYISPSIHQMQGFTSKEFMDKSLDETIVGESLEKVLALYDKKMNLIKLNEPMAWEPEIFEIEQYCKDGSTIWTNIHARFLRGPDNLPKGILGITRDITDRKKNEEEKIKAQKIAGEHKKLALVGQVAGKMAHDFNNVLGIILGHTELALLSCENEEMKKTFNLIFNQTLRGKNLTKDLIAFAKSPEPRQEFFFINEKIDFVLNLIKNDLKGIKITRNSMKIVELIADPGMIEHTLVNLLQNSIHALSKTNNPEIIIRTHAVDTTIVIEIEDNGCGIPEKYMEDIFEPSFTLKSNRDATGSYDSTIKGTGYGMANVKKYIELHKGDIFIESEFGSGTRVIINLPLIKKELTVKEKKQIQKAENYSGKNILIVEDELAISDVQYSILSHAPCNHKVDVAFDGQAAIELFKNNHYDLVSLDYILPGKMSGKDVYSHIRESNKSIPILFISGNINFIESIKALKQKDPHVDHLSKPSQNIEYINSINMLLAKSAPAKA